MKAFATLPLVFMGLVGFCLAQEDEGPTVNLPDSRVLGTLANGVDSFYGMPYAESPAGLNRLKRPVKWTKPLGDFDATTVTPACPQGHFGSVASDIPGHKRAVALDNPLAIWDRDNPVQTSEDCLTITVQRPAGTKAGDNLPVLFMLSGYSFVMGTARRFDATNFIKFGVEIEQPFVLVTANYRTGPWGFLAGKEVMKDGASNLGLRDQRMSMEWASDNIAAFGGDPDKITLWGHASGGNSVFDHLVINGGNATYQQRNLFRGAIMSSGSLLPAEKIDSKKCNGIYDKIAKAASCEKTDTLQCLREKSDTDFANAASAAPGALSAEALRLSYVPRPDGDFIPDSPEALLKDNSFVPVPMIFGTQEDEGTIFAQKKRKVKGTTTTMTWFQNHYFQKATNADMEGFIKNYKNKHTVGSPYGTPDIGNWAGQKRLGSLIGDTFFHLPRRIAMELIASSQPELAMWGYQASYDYKPNATDSFGTAHGSFEAVVFGADEYADSFSTRTTRRYLLNFLYNLDPNSKHVELAPWPKWKVEEPLVLKLNKSSLSTMLEGKKERGYKYLKKHGMFRL